MRHFALLSNGFRAIGGESKIPLFTLEVPSQEGFL